MAGFMDGKKKQSGGNVQREKFGGGSGSHAGGKAIPEDTKVKGAAQFTGSRLVSEIIV